MLSKVYFLFEQRRAVAFHKGVSVIQTSPNELAINFYNNDTPNKLTTTSTVERVQITEGNIVIYGSGQIVTYEYQRDIKHIMQVGNFEAVCDDIAAMEQVRHKRKRKKIN